MTNFVRLYDPIAFETATLETIAWLYLATVVVRISAAVALDRLGHADPSDNPLADASDATLFVAGVVLAPVHEELVYRIAPVAVALVIGAPAAVAIGGVCLTSLVWAYRHNDGRGLVTHTPGAIPAVVAVLAGMPLVAIAVHSVHNAWAVSVYVIARRYMNRDADELIA